MPFHGPIRRTRAEIESSKLAATLALAIRSSLQANAKRTPIAAGITRLGKVEFLYRNASIPSDEDANIARCEESLLIRIRQQRYSCAAKLETFSLKACNEMWIHAEHRTRVALGVRIPFRRKRPKSLTLAKPREIATTPRWYR